MAVAAIVPAVASAGGLFFNGTLTSETYQDNCYLTWHDAAGNKAGCVDSGYTSHTYVTLDKFTGDRVALGMLAPPPNLYYQDGSNYYTYGSAGNGDAFTLSRSQLGIGPYNNGFCAYYSGTNSAVECITS
jgi:hypothetical protein